MSERMTNAHGHDTGDKGVVEQTPAVNAAEHDPEKSGLHEVGGDALKKIPANEGGEA